MKLKIFLGVSLITLLLFACKKEEKKEDNSIQLILTKNGIDTVIPMTGQAILYKDTLLFNAYSSGKREELAIFGFNISMTNNNIAIPANDTAEVSYLLKTTYDTLPYLGISGNFNITEINTNNFTMSGSSSAKAYTLSLDSIRLDSLEARFIFSNFPLEH
ncbi:MAG: hypothetical protein K1X55_12255 [Chitinophagales bacterium]|nr:hypothetical protein [Chitinophagales bacterium]